MLRSSPLLIFATAIAWAVAVHAQTPTVKSDGPAPYRADAFLAVHHPGQSAAPIILDLSGPRASRVRPYAYASAPRTDGQSRTAVDYRFAPDGLFGSVGFFCLSDDRATADRVLGVIDGSQDGRLVGATLRYPFK